MNRAIKTGMLLGWIVVGGCHREGGVDPQDERATFQRALAENELRDQFGHRLIDTNWTRWARPPYTNASWTTPNRPDLSGPEKLIYRSTNGDMIRETDFYFSERNYRRTRFAAPSPECLMFVYEHEDRRTHFVYRGTNSVIKTSVKLANQGDGEHRNLRRIRLLNELVRIHGFDLATREASKSRSSDEKRYDSISDMYMAAQRGEAVAQCQLGLHYQLGFELEKDRSKAMEWYSKAAAQGQPMGHYLIAGLLTSGTPQTKDVARALKHLEFAAVGGVTEAFAILSEVYEVGDLVGRDMIKSYSWQLAGMRLAKDESMFVGASSIANTLTDEEKAEASRLANEWIKLNVSSSD